MYSTHKAVYLDPNEPPCEVASTSGANIISK